MTYEEFLKADTYGGALFNQSVRLEVQRIGLLQLHKTLRAKGASDKEAASFNTRCELNSAMRADNRRKMEAHIAATKRSLK